MQKKHAFTASSHQQGILPQTASDVCCTTMYVVQLQHRVICFVGTSGQKSGKAMRLGAVEKKLFMKIAPNGDASYFN